MHPTTRMNFENIMPSKQCWSGTTYVGMILFIWNVQNRQIYKDKEQMSRVGGGRGMVEDWLLMDSSFQGDENVL